MYKFEAEQWLPITLEKAWSFFSSPLNLPLITPPELQFRIESQINSNEIFEDMIIDYSLKPLFNYRVGWKSMITRVKENELFTDYQLKGPYKIWEHTHYFISQNHGVLMRDEINYDLRLGIIGKFANRLFVRRRIEEIFNYRRRTLIKLFEENGSY